MVVDSWKKKARLRLAPTWSGRSRGVAAVAASAMCAIASLLLLAERSAVPGVVDDMLIRWRRWLRCTVGALGHVASTRVGLEERVGVDSVF